jgi:hypothetical protein
VVALTLAEARRQAGDDLARQVDTIARELDAPAATVSNATLPGDRRRLQGIPAIGRGVHGQATEQQTPGSDEHLDLLDA